MIRSILVLVFFSCVVSAAYAQPSPASSGPGTISIRGVIVSADSGTALRRARVTVTAGARRAAPVFTDDEGRFAVSIEASASYSVVVAKAGYGFARRTLSRAEAAEPQTVPLVRPAAITGLVLDGRGSPLVSASVTARRLDPGAAAGDPAEFSTAADDLGEYRLGGLPPGRYSVAAGPASFFTVSSVGLVGMTSAETIDLRLAAMNGMRGATVLEPTRFNAGPARDVILQSGDDASGVDFVVRTVDPLRQLLDAAAAADVAIRASRSDGQVPPPGMAGAIRGRVMSDSGEPLDQTDVFVVGAGFRRSLRTDAAGAFVVAGLRAGDYTLEASRVGFLTRRYGQQHATHSGATITVGTDRIVEGIDIVLPYGATMTGVIVDEHGEPLQNVEVQALALREAEGRAAATPTGSARRTDDRGRYRLFGLQPGRYLVAASVDATIYAVGGDRIDGYAPTYHPGTPAIEAALPVQLDGDATAIDLVFAPSPAVRVRGVVRDAEGPLVTGAVRLAASRRSSAILVEPRTAPIGPDGAFVFADVSPGEYVVQARGDGPGRTGEFGVEYVSVTHAAPPPLTITTSHGATLEGRLIIDGNPDAGPCANGLRDPVNNGVPCGPTLPAGAFTVRPFGLDADRSRFEGHSGLIVSSTGAFYVSGLTGPTGFWLPQAPDGWYLKSVVINGADVTDDAYDFGTVPQTVVDAEVVISQNGAAITGRVTDRDRAVEDCSVVVFSVLRDQWGPRSRRLKVMRANREGAFRVSGLPQGDYFITAVDRLAGTADAGEWQSVTVLESLAARAERISVAEGESRVVSLRLVRR